MTEDHKKEDEEIAIDFSKIKSWFKKRKSKSYSRNDTGHEGSSHETHTHHKSHETHHHEHKRNDNASEDEATISFDYKATLNFFKRYATVFLILIPVILTIYLRLQPMGLPATEQWAEGTVLNHYRTQIELQVNQQYPNLPDANRNALIEAEFARIMEENKDIIAQQIEGTAQSFKDRFMYESGNSKYIYLGDIDSYYWLREARKYLENGVMCDEVDYENQLCYGDTYTQAPLRSAAPLKDQTIGKNGKSYSYIIVYTYKILHAFNEDMTIMQASYYVPMIFGVLSAILAFLIGSAIGGNVGGLITSIFIATNPMHLSRTLGSDNDPQTIFFPLLIVFLFIYTFKVKSLKNKITLGALTGIAMGFYAAAWQGWWFMFDFLMATLAIYAGFVVVHNLLTHKKIGSMLKEKSIKALLIGTGAILASTIVAISIISGFGVFMNSVFGPLWFSKTKEAALATYWPNVLVTVAEFNPGSIPSIIAQMGGKLIFFLGLLGILFVMLNQGRSTKQSKYVLGFGALLYAILVSSYGASLGPKTYMVLIALPVIVGMLLFLKNKDVPDLKLAILLVIWFIATTYAALKGVRFTLLMVTAFGVSLGIAISAIYKRVTSWISTELKINEIITKTVVAILLLLILIAPIKAGFYTSTHFMPSVSDAWYGTLTKINQESEPDAIINSWWDFGHWFKYLADRRVTLDGSSQSGPPLHWLGKLMVTDDEDHSVGILRMLDCGSNTAFDELNKVLNDTPRSIDILDTIVRLHKRDAQDVLLDAGLTKEEATSVLKNTHCDPPEDFFITSEDMVGKAGVWSHFGSWDFKRAEMYTKVKGKTLAEGKKILADPRYNLTEDEIDQYYYDIQTQDDSQWITPWPSYMSGVTACPPPDDDGVFTCLLGIAGGQQLPLIVDMKTMDVKINAQEEIRPESVVYITENGTEENVFEGKTIPISIILIPSGENSYSVLVSHPYLGNSIFTRLFYLEGHGLKHFDRFDDQRSVTGQRIITWKVDWEGADANSAYMKTEQEAIIEESDSEEAADDQEPLLKADAQDEKDMVEEEVQPEPEDDEAYTDISDEGQDLLEDAIAQLSE